MSDMKKRCFCFFTIFASVEKLIQTFFLAQKHSTCKKSCWTSQKLILKRPKKIRLENLALITKDSSKFLGSIWLLYVIIQRGWTSQEFLLLVGPKLSFGCVFIIVLHVVFSHELILIFYSFFFFLFQSFSFILVSSGSTHIGLLPLLSCSIYLFVIVVCQVFIFF